MDWQPTASIEKLRQRAAFLSIVRAFFAQREVLEVDTPALSASTITDVHLDALQVTNVVAGSNKPPALFLQTSPEFAMKRMLSAGYPDIYQICKCFREDEIGALHNPEFSMLEWYRKGFSMQDLIDEVEQLLMEVLTINGIEQITYQNVFKTYLQFDPFTMTLAELLTISNKKGLGDYGKELIAQGCNQIQLFDAMLQVLFSQEIEPQIGQHTPVCITHFPASQAALAKLSGDGKSALRFEFYYRGIELANGFEELIDVDMHVERFQTDNLHRRQLGKPIRNVDHRFIDSLRAGLPECSGVALGIDRLIMLALDCKSISEVISFDFGRA